MWISNSEVPLTLQTGKPPARADRRALSVISQL